ncbi:MAG: hypothetical protein JW840_06255 [Candidatus Thermoplasmatota archaeon]|nr:hypothetical protein [Candidatus Thermoplasmatota archaeon]
MMALTDKTVLAMGMTSLTMAMLLRYISYDKYPGEGILSFIEGVLVGLSSTMNLFFLIQFSKKQSCHL